MNGAKKLKNSVNVECMRAVQDLAPGSKVVIYCKDQGWDVMTLAKVDCNNVHVVLPVSGLISAFGIHNVRPFLEDEDAVVEEEPSFGNIDSEATSSDTNPLRRKQTNKPVVT